MLVILDSLKAFEFLMIVVMVNMPLTIESKIQSAPFNFCGPCQICLCAIGVVEAMVDM